MPNISGSTDDALIPSDEFVASQGIGKGDFVKFGESSTNWYISQGYIEKDSIVLDIGCGLGRIARPLTKLLGDSATYYGFDINRQSIEWCRERYSKCINFHFQWVNVHSVCYNPKSNDEASTVRFPLSDNYVDFINLTSVFTHMRINDVRAYLLEIARMLKPGKYCYITYFLVNPPVSEHFKKAASKGKWHAIDKGYIQDPDYPERVIHSK